jgi:hypothetical protein
MSRRLVVVLLIALAMAGSGLSPDDAPAGNRRDHPKRRLPRQFGIGLAAHPDETGLYGWMRDAGVPFHYAYQYLAAGVNTGEGWQTWNDEGRFPVSYAEGAAERGAIPVFPYYMLLQSTGPCDGCGEAEQDLAHLNDPGLMRSYFADFATLMQRLGRGTHGGVAGYGRRAIVLVEPDLSGYAHHAVLDNSSCFGHCTGEGNDPRLLRASVASSGFPQVGRYPDTYRGFNLALLHLRDLYAKNVLLAFHVSCWSALHDVCTSRDASLDVRALGKQVAAFASRAGVGKSDRRTSNYDLLTNDVADRDAGFYEHVVGEDRWWDRTNRTLPNFHRWEAFIGAITRSTRKPLLVWQIPLGNQYFRTVDNSWGHYQDNRIEYLLDHVRELIRVGIVGLLFGGGAGGTTVNHDEQGDGVTNPPASCSPRGTSEGVICNDHASEWSDDDGGYLRMVADRYYRDPIRLPRPKRRKQRAPAIRPPR